MENGNQVLHRLGPLLAVLVGCLVAIVFLQHHAERTTPRFLTVYANNIEGMEASNSTIAALQSEDTKSVRGSRMFIGLWSGPGEDYLRRRKAIRETWLTPELRAQYEKELGLVVRFMMGRSEDEDREKELRDEEVKHGDMLRLSVVDTHDNMGKKTMDTFKVGVEMFDPDWLVKMDDDVYPMPERLLQAAAEWQRGNKGYIGCPRIGGKVGREPDTKWYEPLQALYGDEYPKYYSGSVYVLSRDVVDKVLLRNFDDLRHQKHEDAMVGLWMVAFNVQHEDDRRLCSHKCSPTAVVVSHDPDCSGLCEPVEDMYATHNETLCKGPLAVSHTPWETSGPEQ